jgi:uncharacterized protein DUF3489
MRAAAMKRKAMRKSVKSQRRSSPKARRTKQATCLALLERPTGATLVEMQKATGWQPHSIRGFLAGTVKKKLGHDLTSTKEERGRVYRVAKSGGA